MSAIGMKRELSITFKAALEAVPQALQEEGFGVLTQLDLDQILKEKIGADFRRYRVLGACNPNLAYEALQKDLSIGVMVPCNVVIYEGDDGKATVVAVDPLQTAAASGGPALEAFARGVRDKLRKVLDAL